MMWSSPVSGALEPVEDVCAAGVINLVKGMGVRLLNCHWISETKGRKGVKRSDINECQNPCVCRVFMHGILPPNKFIQMEFLWFFGIKSTSSPSLPTVTTGFVQHCAWGARFFIFMTWRSKRNLFKTIPDPLLLSILTIPCAYVKYCWLYQGKIKVNCSSWMRCSIA